MAAVKQPRRTGVRNEEALDIIERNGLPEPAEVPSSLALMQFIGDYNTDRGTIVIDGDVKVTGSGSTIAEFTRPYLFITRGITYGNGKSIDGFVASTEDSSFIIPAPIDLGLADFKGKNPRKFGFVMFYDKEVVGECSLQLEKGTKVYYSRK
jgi:hypothetical protein